jgi:hypothetical protein
MNDGQDFRCAIEATTRNALMSFITHFGRNPTEDEAMILAAAISRYFGIPNPNERTH